MLPINQQMLEIGIAQRVNGAAVGIELIVAKIVFITFLLQELLSLKVVGLNQTKFEVPRAAQRRQRDDY